MLELWKADCPFVEDYLEQVKNGKDRKKVMDDLGLKRYCCRAMFLGHIDLIDTVARFKKN